MTNQDAANSQERDTEYRFDYFGQPVRWRTRQFRRGNDFVLEILCAHAVFKKYFPAVNADFSGVINKSKDLTLDRSDRLFFQNMIDSCDTA